jgi:hypothetical protein
MFPRWLSLYLLAIAALTLFPFATPECPSAGWVVRFAGLDFLANLLAFAPIGIAQRRAPRWRALAVPIPLSLTIEICQQWLPRQQDVMDLVSNTLGAGLGHVVARYWMNRWPGPVLRPVTIRLALLLMAPGLLIITLDRTIARPANDFSNWADFPLVIGNSAQGNRPWMGEISEVALFDRALGGDEEAPILSSDDTPALWVEGGPVLWLRFDGGEPTGRIDGPSGPVRYEPHLEVPPVFTGAGLSLRPSGLRLEPWVSDHLTDRLRTAGRLTLDVRMRSHVERQWGPARIIDLGDGRRRNVMLGQRGTKLVARIRTPSNGLGGGRAEIHSWDDAVSLEDQHVRLSYDGSRAVLWVDGRCEDVSHMAIVNAPRTVGPFLGVNIVLCTALAGLAAGAAARRRSTRLALGMLSGACAWTLLWQVGAWSHLTSFTGSAVALGALSLAAIVPILIRPR